MVKDNIARVKERVALACSKAKRNLSGIKIVAVSKGRGIEDIKEAIACGLTDIGENRVQEAILKHKNLSTIDYPCLSGRQGLSTIKWHMVGHLQTNKVRDAVRIFSLIQSVDSLKLALEINKEAEKVNKVQDILIEIKTSPEVTKSGLKPEELPAAIKEIKEFKNINIKGLMTIALVVKHSEEARPCFKMLRQLRDSSNTLYNLSMGMTDDFEVAIEEGADIIRIGRGIYEG